ncbi:hypothetical protein D1BOALGB6SA_4089 [Olavius sp. associated proteobacterium Delta 1]|nr:hypothetical protein D1BOALGB6SA_4089 [Olavius sp. associated proteobacterium Delta 1]
MPFSGRDSVFWQKGHQFLEPNCFEMNHVYILSFDRNGLMIIFKATKLTNNID